MLHKHPEKSCVIEGNGIGDCCPLNIIAPPVTWMGRGSKTCCIERSVFSPLRALLCIMCILMARKEGRIHGEIGLFSPNSAYFIDDP